VQRWRQQVSRVATQEMLHLALVHNLLPAIGAAPHMVRPDLPGHRGLQALDRHRHIDTGMQP